MSSSLLVTLQQGVQCHADGRLDDAARFYGDALQRDPSSSDAWHLLGRVCLARRDFGGAAACVSKSIQLRMDLPAYHCTLGDILAAQGRGADAILCYREALRLDPRWVPAWVNMGTIRHKAGQPADACAAYARAIEIEPGSAEAFNNLGNSLTALGRLDEAAECFHQSLRLRPNQPHAAVNLAACCLRQRREKEAEEWSRYALEKQPGMTEALSNLATALLDQRRLPEAEEAVREALAHRPEMAHLHSNLATVLLEQRRWDEAERECRQALQLDPGHRDVRLNLAVVLQRSGRLEQAAAELHDLLEADPRNADAWTNLGTVRTDQGRHDAALFCFEEALRFQPDHAKAHFCHSLEVLGSGNLQEGFAEYEWRWKVVPPGRADAGKRWDGSALEGRTILLQAEQGLGDTIQFARYIPLVEERGGRVIVESQPAVAPIVRSVRGTSQVILPHDPLPPFELQAPLLSLPHIFTTSLDTIPNHSRYVPLDGELAARLSARLGPVRGLRVGLAWAGNPENGGDLRRSMRLDNLSPLRTVGGVEFFSLHVDRDAREAVSAVGGWVREILSNDGGLVELAALMSCLDLVISVDTMAVHLAGALGRPVWNLLCAAPDWRWTRQGERTPWYPSMRLFRQPVLGDWEPVIERVICELRCFSSQALAGGADMEIEGRHVGNQGSPAGSGMMPNFEKQDV